jgi:hypothetical protein
MKGDITKAPHGFHLSVMRRDSLTSGVLSLTDRGPGLSSKSCVLFGLAIGGVREPGSRRNCLVQLQSWYLSARGGANSTQAGLEAARGAQRYSESLVKTFYDKLTRPI